MKRIVITKFTLNNYAPFYETMGIKTFTFDRSKSNNKIVLIIGENGSGKTFLLTELSPEPLEHIDGRTGDRFIADEKGEKIIEFTIEDNGVAIEKYIAHITYAPNKDETHKTSCSFKRVNPDGTTTELNANGNVSSYMDLCKMYLGYDKTYRNIGYMSGQNNVKNIINMSEADRQSLISTWLPDTSEFLTKSKLVYKKLNYTNKEIDNINNDLAKMVVGDLENQLNVYQRVLDERNARYKLVSENISVGNTYRNMLLGFTTDSIKQKLESFKKERTEYISRYDKYQEISTKFVHADVSYKATLNQKLSEIEIEERSVSEEIAKCDLQISVNSAKDSSPEGDIVSIDKGIKSNEETIAMLKNQIIHEDYVTRYENLQDRQTAISKAIATLTGICGTVGSISSTGFNLESLFDIDVVKETNETLAETRSTLETLKSRQTELNELLMNIKNDSIDFNEYRKYIPARCSSNTCSLIAYMISKDANSSAGKLAEVNAKLNECVAEINRTETYLSEKQTAASNAVFATTSVSQINQSVAELSVLSPNLPANISDKIANGAKYVATHASEMLTEMRTEEDTLSVVNKIKAADDAINNLTNMKNIVVASAESKRVVAEANKKKTELLKERETIIAKRNEIKSEIEQFDNYLNNRDKLIVEYHFLKETHDKLESEFNEINLSIEKYNIYNKISSILGKLNEEKIKLEKDIATNGRLIEEIKSKIISRETLESRMSVLKSKAKIYETLYNTWNPKTGYPSMLIDDFLSQVVYHTNQDLNELWGGTLCLEDIDTSNFKIPVVRGFSKLEDVKSCSTAEKSTINLSLSFGIIEASDTGNSRYTVIRADEVDSGYDAYRRQGFLDNIVNKLDKINCGNAYIITHNNSFENIECDVILLKGYEQITSSEMLANKNIIFKYA